MFNLIDKIKNSEVLIITIIVYSVIITLFSIRVCLLYFPNAEIMLHDYGQVFESIEEWQIWRIEHYKGDALND